MEVIAFFGPPGTGKSDRALVVAYENKASCIIDDGILIYHSRIVAGKSAKRESRLKAVRRAIFWDAEQREEVRQALEKINPKRVLILGTSDRMVETICKALGLPKPSKYIRIQDVARPDEMLKAKEARNKEGKHVIPVPTMELKPYFKGYLIDPLRFFRNRKKEMPKRFSENEERSVVRPVFSYYGKLSFSDRVIESLVYYAVRDMKNPHYVCQKREKHGPDEWAHPFHRCLRKARNTAGNQENHPYDERPHPKGNRAYDWYVARYDQGQCDDRSNAVKKIVI